MVSRLPGYLVVLYAGVLGAAYTSIPEIDPIDLAGYLPFYLPILAVAARRGGLSVCSYYVGGVLLALGTQSFVLSGWKLAWAVLVGQAVFAVTVPLLLTSHHLGIPARVAVPGGLHRFSLVAPPVVAGATAAAVSASPRYVAGVFVVGSAGLSVLIWLYRRFGDQPEFRLPRWVWGVVAAFAVAVLVTRLVTAPDIPGPTPIALTLAGLVILATAFWRSARLDAADHIPAPQPFQWPAYLRWLGLWALLEGTVYTGLRLLGEDRFPLLLVLSSAIGVTVAGYLLYCLVVACAHFPIPSASWPARPAADRGAPPSAG